MPRVQSKSSCGSFAIRDTSIHWSQHLWPVFVTWLNEPVSSVRVGRQEESLGHFVLPELVGRPGLTYRGWVVEERAHHVDVQALVDT